MSLYYAMGQRWQISVLSHPSRVAQLLLTAVAIFYNGPTSAQTAAPASAPQTDATTAPTPTPAPETFQPAAPTNPAPPTASGRLTLDQIQSNVLDKLAKPPRYFSNTYRSAMQAPLPAIVFQQGGVPRLVPAYETDRDPTGRVASYQPAGPVTTASNAFFQSLGTNGRSCATCHQPSSAMSVSV